MSLAKNAIALASFVAVAMNVANAQTIDQQQPLINDCLLYTSDAADE